jgi:hypothetical protein
MADFNVVRSALADYFRMIQSEIDELTQPLTTEQLWTKPYPYGNSIGNLILHLTGNFNYYVGAQIAGSGYVRHRDQEFTDAGKPKEALLGDFDRAVEVALSTITRQSDGDWAAPYSADNEPESKDRFTRSLPLRRPRLPSCRPNRLLTKGTAKRRKVNQCGQAGDRSGEDVMSDNRYYVN